MRPCQIIAAIIAKFFCLVLMVSTASHAQQLPGSIAAQLKKYGIPQDAVSIEIREADSQQVVLKLNNQIPRNPASAIKLVTTLAALEILGPDYQWKTSYWADGEIAEGRIKGDLILQGGGDPFISVDQFWYHVLSLRQSGIDTIDGSLVIDNTLFNLPPYNRADFDGQPTRLYNVEPDAALVNLSATHIVIRPVANQIRVIADPPLADLEINNKIKPASGKCINRNSGWSYGIHRQGEKVIVNMNGEYRSRCGRHSIARSLVSNNEYTFRLFKYLWESSGGTFTGGYRIGRTPEHAIAIISHDSKPLADIISSINKYSNNVMSRQLLLSLDSHFDESPSTVSGGRKAILNWVTKQVAVMPELVIDNGSGLSRNARITATALSDILHKGWVSNFHPEFLSSLSLSALDGTMRKRLHDSDLVGRARIKTGLINGVRSMAGYVNSRSNKHYTVTMMIASKKISYWNGNEIQDALLEWVYDR